MPVLLYFSGGDGDSVAGEGSDVEDFLDAYGNVIDPADVPAKKPTSAAAKQASSADSDTESNVSKEEKGQKGPYLYDVRHEFEAKTHETSKIKLHYVRESALYQ